jgi:hypothetical protein
MDKQAGPQPNEYTKAAFVVYLRGTGQVVHTHQVVVYPGATEPTDAEMEAEARALAAGSSGRGEAELEVLPVRREELRPGVLYRVDLSGRRLVEDSGEVTQP